MKAALILSTDIETSPYAQYYIDILNTQGIEYDIIGWDKHYPIKHEESNFYFYDLISLELQPSYRKLIDCYFYSRFVIKHLKSAHYDYIIVFTIVNAVFLSTYLKHNFDGKFVFDIRDYSPVLKFFKSRVKFLINHSSINCISSKGFETWLPDGKYTISHNIRSFFLKSLYPIKPFNRSCVKVLSIGGLRDISESERLLHDLGNKDTFTLVFSGDGVAKVPLENYAKMNNISNVLFTGRYNKNDEPMIVYDSDFINILLPVDINGTSLMSNRFYLSILHHKHMIVNAESYQAKYVRKYNLGVVVESGDNVCDKIIEYMNLFDAVSFNNGCEECLREIEQDAGLFEISVINALSLH